MPTDAERRAVAWLPDGTDPMPGVPEVRVLDEEGHEVLRGWYARHENRQPYCFGDGLRPEDVDHCVIVDGFADWGLPKSLEVKKVTPPHRIEVVGEVDRDALLALADEISCTSCDKIDGELTVDLVTVWGWALAIREALGVSDA